MTISIETMRQVQTMIRPLNTRTLNMIGRGVVNLVDDDKMQQLLQLGGLPSSPVPDAENFQPYGLSVVPLVGAEHVTVFPNGDGSHPLVIVVSDRRYRPTGGEPGEVTLHNHVGAKITMMANGDIEVRPAPGRDVFIRSEGGTADKLVKKGEYDGHTHPAGELVAPSGGGPVTGVSGGAAAVAGTQTLMVE